MPSGRMPTAPMRRVARVCWGLKLPTSTPSKQTLLGRIGVQEMECWGLQLKTESLRAWLRNLCILPVLAGTAAVAFCCAASSATRNNLAAHPPNVRIPGKTTTAYYGMTSMASYLIHTYDLCIIDLPGLMAGLYFPSLSISFFNLFSHFWRFG